MLRAKQAFWMLSALWRRVEATCLSQGSTASEAWPFKRTLSTEVASLQHLRTWATLASNSETLRPRETTQSAPSRCRDRSVFLMLNWVLSTLWGTPGSSSDATTRLANTTTNLFGLPKPPTELTISRLLRGISAL